MLSYSSGKLLNVFKQVVSYLISFNIFLPTTQVFCLLVLVGTATVDKTAQSL